MTDPTAGGASAMEVDDRPLSITGSGAQPADATTLTLCSSIPAAAASGALVTQPSAQQAPGVITIRTAKDSTQLIFTRTAYPDGSHRSVCYCGHFDQRRAPDDVMNQQKVMNAVGDEAARKTAIRDAILSNIGTQEGRHMQSSHGGIKLAAARAPSLPPPAADNGPALVGDAATETDPAQSGTPAAVSAPSPGGPSQPAQPARSTTPQPEAGSSSTLGTLTGPSADARVAASPTVHGPAAPHGGGGGGGSALSGDAATEATPTSSAPPMPSADAQEPLRSDAGHGGGGGGSALGDGLEGGAAYGELTLGQLMIDDPRDGFETDNPAYSPQAESLTELVDQLRSELEAGCPSRVLTGTFDRLRRELEAVCRHRDELLLRAAPYISEPDDCALNARGSIAGRYVTYQTDAGDFDGRIINELPGGYARILWYDRVEDYPRETYVPWLRSKDQSSRFRIKVGDESQADIPNLVPSPPEESSQLKRQRTPP